MSDDAKYDWLNVNKAVESSATDLHSIAFNSIDVNAGTSYVRLKALWPQIHFYLIQFQDVLEKFSIFSIQLSLLLQCVF